MHGWEVKTTRAGSIRSGVALGPVDRVSFFAEQARHRRATWRLSALCTVAVILAGIPLSLVLTPIAFTALVLLAKATSLAATFAPSGPLVIGVDETLERRRGARTRSAGRASRAAWYRKPRPTFADALAAVRRDLWWHQVSQSSAPCGDIVKLPRRVVEHLTDTLCYAT